MIATAHKTLDWRLRATISEDRELLLRIYSSTRQEELSLVDWTAEQKEAFVQMQFNAQDTYYKQVYPDATYDIVRWNNNDVGRLYLRRSSTLLRIIDISLLPEYRGQGLGSSILHDLLREADGQGLTVGIHVEAFNPAHRLYERLGFHRKYQEGVYWYMEYAADKNRTPLPNVA